MKVIFWVLMFSTFFMACQKSSEYSIRQKRVPSSISSQQQLRDFLGDMAARVEEGTNDPIYCATELNQAYETLLHMSAESSGVLGLSMADWESLVNLSFHSRLQIKEQLKRLKVEGPEERACLKSVKDIVRAMRYVEDYLVELIYLKKNRGQKLIAESFDSLEGHGPHFLINPKFKRDFKNFRDLESGDIIISRGGAYSSAAIARIGTNDTQFSHLTLIHKNEAGKITTVESLIEVGALTADFQKFLDYRHSRLVVLRHPDRELAKQAADYMFKRVNQALDSGTVIEYDFKMDYKKHDRLFCTEVAYEGYHVASGGEVEIPSYTTSFLKENLPFLQMAGLELNEDNIETFRTFAPGDIQFDGQFDVVAEYRNPAKLQDSRVKDAILTKMFDWMGKYGYDFDPSFKVNTISYASWLLRRTPLVRKLLDERMPLNMRPSQLKVFFMLDKVGEVLQKRVEHAQAKIDVPLTPIQIYTLLDEYRKKDDRRYKIYQQKKRDLRKLELHSGGRGNMGFHEKRNLRREMKANRPHFHQNYRAFKKD